MSQSVSFILPIRNFEEELRNRVHTILEVLGELTNKFDLVIVDYGSQDDSPEIAWELLREFPQVDFFSHRLQGDLLSAIEAGIHRTSGEIIFVHDTSLPLSLSAIQGLWQLRNDQDLVMAQSRSLDEPRVGQRNSRDYSFARTGRSSLASKSSVQMIRRSAMPPQPVAPTTSRLAVDRVTRTDLIGESPEATRLPKLLSRLRRLASP